MTSDILYTIFIIFTGTAILSTFALYTRQSLLVAYLFLGILAGPWCFKFVSDPTIVGDVAEVGIIFLLFLLGLDLHPQDLIRMFREVTFVSVVGTLVFALIGFLIGYIFSFTLMESVIIGVALTFSSTIIGLKLLPTTALHHQRIGNLMISILLLQDILAIIVLLFLHAADAKTLNIKDFVLILLALPGLGLFAYVFQKYVIANLFKKFSKIKEYVFLLSIGWCLGMAELATHVGLSAEIGSFLAGVSIASGPISLFIAVTLKPLRDFFLVMFFFSVGATFNLTYLPAVLAPALILGVFTLWFKPWIFRVLLIRHGEKPEIARETGVRLGQGSEFSLLIAYLATSTVPALISPRAQYLIQATTIFTFVVSSYWVVFKYPTPVAMSESLRRD
jgi:Kef-type K+ transport system membrane component KefB